MPRWKAAVIHLAISVLLAGTVGILLYTVWFPQPYFFAAGAAELLPLLMGVDIVLGPLLTLAVYSPRKPKKQWHLDLGIIIALQTVAFGYGFYVVCQARPVFIVVERDRIILVSANDLSDADLALGSRPEYRKRSWTGPRLVGALPPRGNETGTLAMQVLAGGKDIDQLPRFYVPYEQVTASLLRHAKPISLLHPANEDQSKKLAALASLARSHGQILHFIPLQRRPSDYAAIFSSDPGRPVAVLAIDPWSDSLSK